MPRRQASPVQIIIREFHQLSPSDQTIVLECLKAVSKPTGTSVRRTSPPPSLPPTTTPPPPATPVRDPKLSGARARKAAAGPPSPTSTEGLPGLVAQVGD